MTELREGFEKLQVAQDYEQPPVLATFRAGLTFELLEPPAEALLVLVGLRFAEWQAAVAADGCVLHLVLSWEASAGHSFGAGLAAAFNRAFTLASAAQRVLTAEGVARSYCTGIAIDRVNPQVPGATRTFGIAESDPED